MTADASWTEHPSIVDYYAHHRGSSDELYPSERRFLPWLAAHGRSVLDVGCASGGFLDVWHEFRSDVDYSGVDLSLAQIQTAQARHPDVRFDVADCAERLPRADRSVDVVQALGWLHWEPRWRDALREMWRVADRFVFFDVRVVDEASDRIDGRQKIALDDDWDEHTTVPYLCLAWDRLCEFLCSLGPGAIDCYGYWGKPNDTIGVPDQVYFATFVLERGEETTTTDVVCVGELTWPARLADGVTVLPPSELDRRIPTKERG